jgi:hypothetical protein
VRKVIAGLVVLAAVIVAVVAYGYSNLEVGSAEVQEVRPEFTPEALQAVDSPIRVVIGDPKDSLEKYITGMRVKVAFNVENDGLIPTFLPFKRYTLFLGNLPVGEMDGAGPAWLGGGSLTPGAVDVLVPPGALPPEVVDALMDGGTVELTVQARLGWGPATVLRESASLTATLDETIRATLGLPAS